MGEGPKERRNRIMAVLADGPMTSREIAAKLRMPWAQCHSNIDILRKYGWIQRYGRDRWVLVGRSFTPSPPRVRRPFRPPPPVHQPPEPEFVAAIGKAKLMGTMTGAMHYVFRTAQADGQLGSWGVGRFRVESDRL